MGMFMILISALAYGAESVFLTRYYRFLNVMSVFALRGIVFSIGFLPLLFFVPLTAFSAIYEFLPLLILAGLVSCLANWGFGKCLSYFPVGVANVYVTILQVLVMSLLGTIFMGDALTLFDMAIMAVLVAGNAALVLQNYQSDFDFHKPIWKGIVYGLVNGIFQSIAFIILIKVARDVDPLLSGFIWELAVTFFSILCVVLPACYVVFMRYISAGFHRPHHDGWVREAHFLVRFTFSPKFFDLAWRAAPTIPATACYAYASLYLPAGILQAIFMSVGLFAAIIAAFMHGEWFTRMQAIGFCALVLIMAFYHYMAG